MKLSVLNLHKNTCSAVFMQETGSLQACQESSLVLIPVFWACDGKNDCPMGTDEVDCPCEMFDLIQMRTSSNNSACVPLKWSFREDDSQVLNVEEVIKTNQLSQGDCAGLSVLCSHHLNCVTSARQFVIFLQAAVRQL